VLRCTIQTASSKDKRTALKKLRIRFVLGLNSNRLLTEYNSDALVLIQPVRLARPVFVRSVKGTLDKCLPKLGKCGLPHGQSTPSITLSRKEHSIALSLYTDKLN
jgi:hypothetical protein